MSGPLDSLKTVDPYEIVNGLPENEITSVLDRLDTSFLDSIKPQLNQESVNAALRLGKDFVGAQARGLMPNMRGGMPSLRGIASNVGGAIPGLSGIQNMIPRGAMGSVGGMNINSIMQYGRQLAPELTSSLDGIQAETRNSILQTIREYEISPAITRSLTNVFGSTSMTRLMSVNGVQGFVNSFTRAFTGGRTPNLSNPRFVSLLLGGVIHQGNKLGMDGFLGDIFDVLDHPTTINLISGLVVKSVAMNGSLRDYHTLATKSTPGYLRSVRPNTIKEFIRNYRAPRYDGVRKLPDELLMMETTLTAIDPNWRYRLVTPEDDTLNLYQLMGGSKEFNELMQYAAIAYPDTVNDWHWTLANLQNFRTYTVRQEIRKAFPYVVFKNQG